MNEIDKLNNTLRWTNKGHKILNIIIMSIRVLVIASCIIFINTLK